MAAAYPNKIRYDLRGRVLPLVLSVGAWLACMSSLQDQLFRFIKSMLCSVCSYFASIKHGKGQCVGQCVFVLMLFFSPLIADANVGCGLDFFPAEWKPLVNVDQDGYVCVDIELASFKLKCRSVPLYLRFSSKPDVGKSILGQGWSMNILNSKLVQSGQYSYKMSLPNFQEIEFYKERGGEVEKNAVNFSSSSAWAGELDNDGVRFKALGGCSSQLNFKDHRLVRLVDGKGNRFYISNRGFQMANDEGESIRLSKTSRGYFISCRPVSSLNGDLSLGVSDDLIRNAIIGERGRYVFTYSNVDEAGSEDAWLNILYQDADGEIWTRRYYWNPSTGLATKYEYKNELLSSIEHYSFIVIPDIKLVYPLIVAKNSLDRLKISYRDDEQGIRISKDYVHKNATYERFSTEYGRMGLLRERCLLDVSTGRKTSLLEFKYDQKNRLARIISDGQLKYVYSYECNEAVIREIEK